MTPWRIGETGLDLANLARQESVFALANGHIGLRGNLDEGEPFGVAGTYLNSFYELRPLPYAEAGYGYPESGQTIVNVTNGKLIRLLVDDEPLDLRYGTLLAHERGLDLRDGVLRRRLEWRSPAGASVRVRSTRLVSFTQRAIAAIEYIVEPLEDSVRIVVQSELVANEAGSAVMKSDPRAAVALEHPLVGEEHQAEGARALLVHSTRQSKLRMAAAMDHVFDCSDGLTTSVESGPDVARITFATYLERGEQFRIVKLLAYGWSSQRSQPAIRDQVAAALTAARRTGWSGLLAAQRGYLDDFWSCADVEVDGDSELQDAVRLGLFHTLQAGARSEERAIPAKGLTGPGYDGHTFWDTERFVLPVLTYTAPAAAVSALRWRHRTLDLARERSAQLGLAGAAFPWRTIRGQECSGYWPAGTAAFHLAADIADAVARYENATGDENFARNEGLELLVETARLWLSLGHHDLEKGTFRIDGVTGPDEYSAISDNNVYTNLLAQRNLRAAAAAVERFPSAAANLAVEPGEPDRWRAAADDMVIPRDNETGIHPQSERFLDHAPWDFAGTGVDRYPLLLHFPYFDLYRKQVVKQADLVLALHWCGDSFTYEQKARNFAYYEAITVRDSSLSASTQAVIAAEVGHLDLAYNYFAEASLIDLRDLNGNTSDGLHIASLAGSWLAVVAGFGGMRDFNGCLAFDPQLPDALHRISFGLCVRGRKLRVEVMRKEAIYHLVVGEPIELQHRKTRFKAEVGKPVSLPIERRLPLVPCSQPAGRAPRRRSAVDGSLKLAA